MCNDKGASILVWYLCSQSFANKLIFNKDNMQITGPIPTLFGNLTSLEFLNMGKFNILVDCSNLIRIFELIFLTSYFLLPQMTTIGNNFLNGTIPSELGQLKKLKSICIRRNHLTGSIPTEIGSMGKLEILDIRE